MSKASWVALTLALDALLINLGFISAFLIRFGGTLPTFNFEAYLGVIVPVTLLQIVLFATYDLYDPERITSRWELLTRLIAAVTVGMLVTVFITFFLREFSFPRLVILLSWFSVITIVLGGRLTLASALRVRWPARRVLIVGGGDQAERIGSELKKRGPWGYEVVGVEESQAGVAAVLAENKVDQIIVTSPSEHRSTIDTLITGGVGPIQVDVVPELYEIYVGRPDHVLLSDVPLVAITSGPPSGWRLLGKRLFDLALALLLAPVLITLTPFVAVIVKLSGPGPVIFSQERVGRGGRAFRVLKFRTMVDGAEGETGPVMATQDDSRITPFGRFMRRTRIDELPQLVNVFRAEMSFVGPRPERPSFVSEFTDETAGYGERFSVRPGITGLAQVSGDYATTAENKLKYDLIYIRHRSLALDLRILLQTLRVVLSARG